MASHEGPAIPAADQAFLDGALDELLRRVEDGLPISVDELAAPRVDLRARIEDLVRMVQEVAVTGRRDHPEIRGYSVLSLIGRGGMGAVYLARQDRVGGRMVALKVLPGASAISETARERFVREAQALGKLKHTNIVTIYDVVQGEGVLAYAMEWIEGRSLADVIDAIAERSGASESSRSSTAENRQPKAMQTVRECLASPADALKDGTYITFIARLGQSIAKALGEVHRAGLLHRDIKPSNILIRRDGTPLLSDFGLVRDPGSGGGVTLTEAGQFAGTPAYAAPEQLRGDLDQLDARSDVYSLAATLYHALALRPPFEGSTPGSILRQIEAGKFAPLKRSRLGSTIPADLQTIIAKGLDADPARRYATADELADDLDRLLHLQPIKARPASMITRGVKFARRNRAAVITAFIASTLTLTLATLLAVYTFIVPKWVDAHVREAHLAMLDPVHTDNLFASEFWNEPMSVRTGAAFSGQRQAQRIGAIVEAYDAALKWQPWHHDCLLERDVAVLAGQMTGEHPNLTLVWTRDEELLQTTVFATRWINGQRMSGPEDDRLASASIDDLRALGLVAFLCNDVDTAMRAWARLDMVREPDPLIEAALGQLHIARNEPARAYPRLRRAVLAFPDVDFLQAYLAQAALSAGDIEKAGLYLDRADALDVDQSLYEIDRVRAQWFAVQGRLDEAEALFALPSLQADALSHYEHARLLRRRGHIQPSIVCLLSSLDLAPKSQIAGEELIATADQWWESLAGHERANALESALHHPVPGRVDVLTLLRRYVAFVPSPVDPNSQDSAENTPESSTTEGATLSPILQEASLFDIARILEVQDMHHWNRVINLYPSLFQRILAAAWLTPWSQSVRRWLDEHSPTTIRRLALRESGVIAAIVSLCFTPIVVGGSLELNNTGESLTGYVRIPHDSALQPQTLTIEFWLTPTGVGHGNSNDSPGPTVFGSPQDGFSGNYNYGYEINWSPVTQRVRARVANNAPSSGAEVFSNTLVPMNTTAHVAFTFDGTTLKLYINGVLDASASSGFSAIHYISSDTLIGAANSCCGYLRRFDGVLDDVRLWNVARSAADIASNYQTGLTGTEANLVAYYPFCNGSLEDKTGHGHNGTPQGNGVALNATELPPTNPGAACKAQPVCEADVTNNGVVNIDDLLAVINGWGACK